MSYIKLYNNIKIPCIGFGTAGLQTNEKTYTSVLEALKQGFRHIDSAQALEWYKESAVGKALTDFLKKNKNITRKDLWITTKLHKKNHGYDSAIKCLFQSFKDLNTTYVDLYLLHHPCKDSYKWKESWRALEYLYKKGYTKSIGVSNFNLERLHELEKSGNILPHVIQNWFDPCHQDKSIREYCEKKKITYIGYSTLGGQWRRKAGYNIVQENSIIKKLAPKYNVSVPFFILSWAKLANPNVIIIPRSSSIQHIKENSDLLYRNLKISRDDLKRMNDLDRN
jgi:diketogulonate reductase-like aldo/keto reductase